MYSIEKEWRDCDSPASRKISIFQSAHAKVNKIDNANSLEGSGLCNSKTRCNISFIMDQAENVTAALPFQDVCLSEMS